jgi:hypothetical protein
VEGVAGGAGEGGVRRRGGVEVERTCHRISQLFRWFNTYLDPIAKTLAS